MKQAEAVKGIFNDLLTMEVNVILKAGMTARKMPLTWEAFHDVVDKYYAFLNEYFSEARIVVATEEWDEKESEEKQWERPRSRSPQYVGRADFRYLAAWARAAGDSAQANRGDRAVVLFRIERNSSRLAPMMPPRGVATRAEDGTWDAVDFEGNKENLMILRKAWEVGTESVVMQTVAQVDGDIVTRIQDQHAGPEHQQIHGIHQEMVGESLQHWRFLFATVATFTLGVFASFFD